MAKNAFPRSKVKAYLKWNSPQGANFDPDMHEAITEVPMGEDMKGKIVDTVEKRLPFEGIKLFVSQKLL